MLLTAYCQTRPRVKTNQLKILLIMKLTTCLLFVAFMHASAKGIAQKVTLNESNSSLQKVLKKIENQTGYTFLYENDVIKKVSPVTLQVKQAPLDQVLHLCFNDQPLTYKIFERTVVIKERAALNAVKTDEAVISAANIVTGKVTNSTGEPLAGVSITVKGTNVGVSADGKGNYSIDVPRNGTLVFSYVGFETKEIAVNGHAAIDVVLKTESANLNQVVVVGYGTQKRISVTGAVDQVTAEDIAGRPATNVLNALQGESPNLIIQQTNLSPGSPVNLNIRGLGTLGDNTPLIVIDGVIGGDINLINPNDIASVSILKDAGSAAIYGSRAANGVMLITTKKGKLNGKTIINYDGTYGIQHSAVLLHKLDAWENAEYKNQSLINSGLPPAYSDANIAQFKAQGNGTWDSKHVLKTAPFQTHNLSISGGGENSSYFISGGYQNQESNLIGNGGSGPDFGYQNYNLRLNQSATKGKLKVNTILNYNKNRNKTTSQTLGNVFADANRLPYQYNFQDTAGNYLTNPISSQVNVLGVLKQGGYNQTDNDQVFGNFNATLNVTNDIKLTGIVGGTIINNSSVFRSIELDYVTSGVSGNDRRTRDNSLKSILVNTQFYAEYDKNIKKSTFKALLGVSNESFTQKGFQLQQEFTDPILGVPTTGTIVETASSNNTVSNTTQTSINSLFGRLSYSYDNKYFLEGTFREDGSSKFATGRRWGFFPSVGASWLASAEPFMKFIKAAAISTLKLRASYGVLGNQNVNAYQYYSTYSTYGNAYGFNNNIVNGGTFRLGNPDLAWESAAILNLGIDAAFFNNKLQFSFDGFNKVTSDILYARQDVPTLYGATLPDYNVAKVRNRGWEFKVGYKMQTGQFEHDINFNIANTNNTLLNLTSGLDVQIANKGEFAFIRQVGYPITEYYSYKVAGIFQTQDEVNKSAKPAGLTLAPGDLKFVDANGDGVIDNKDRVRLGDPFPHYTFGFNYSIAYKGFDFSVLIQGVGQRAAMIRGELVQPYQANYGATMFEHQTDFWTPTNTDAKLPRLGAVGSNSVTNNWIPGSSIFLFNAAYARLKNLNVGYTFAPKLMKKARIQTLRISFIAQNIWTTSKLNWVDPETSEFNNNVALSASSNSARGYPLPITYSVGLNLTF